METKLDNAFRTLIELLREIDEWNFSRAMDDVYRELLSNPSKGQTAKLRTELRSLIASRPGGIVEMYIPGNAKKSRELTNATNVVRSFARRRLLEFIIPPSKI
ncbi:hypothetical protein NMP99_01300 [Glutamicibacter mishrai]|uniref:hypothetical protein n=1 Tax=Glutamicibacter mishrai TaxID=1775880 RepID=UPI0020CEE406|nr:hypothetical protein [Glutamicibacter mishrai]UTT39975.1 hypothetical protein NMP99_01300 [Glutamicibacter mishrai]